MLYEKNEPKKNQIKYRTEWKIKWIDKNRKL